MLHTREAWAYAVLAAGGALEVVLPSRDYREAKVKPDHAEQFDRLLGAAQRVLVMDDDHASRAAYEMVNLEPRCDRHSDRPAQAGVRAPGFRA